MYTAVILDEKSRSQLLAQLIIPEGWEIIADHVTINMGAAKNVQLGSCVDLIVKSYALDDRVMAVAVDGDIPSDNEIKHITIAVNRRNGGKPVHSNKLTNWIAIPELIVSGAVQEVK